MASEYPYPEAEHLNLNLTSFGEIDEELRCYRTGPEFRLSIAGLINMYRQTEFGIGIKKASHMLVLAQAIKDGDDCREVEAPEISFYSGGIFATHISVKPLSKRLRLGVLTVGFYAGREVGFSGDRVADEGLRQQADHLADYRDEQWRELFDTQQPELRKRVRAAAIRMYEDMPDDELQDNFMAGHLFSHWLVQTHLKANGGGRVLNG